MHRKVAVGANIQPIKLISGLTDPNTFLGVLALSFEHRMSCYYHGAANLSFWPQMITAAHAVHATVVFRNWLRVKVSYLKDLIMISRGNKLWPQDFDLFSRVACKNLGS